MALFALFRHICKISFRTISLKIGMLADLTTTNRHHSNDHIHDHCYLLALQISRDPRPHRGTSKAGSDTRGADFEGRDDVQFRKLDSKLETQVTLLGTLPSLCHVRSPKRNEGLS